jgi:hypothetical protein
MNPKLKNLSSTFLLLARRFLFVVIFLAWLLVLTLWVRSYWAFDTLGFRWSRHYVISSDRGLICFERRIPNPEYMKYAALPAIPHPSSISFICELNGEGSTHPPRHSQPPWVPFETGPGVLPGLFTHPPYSGRAISVPAYALAIPLSLWPLWTLYRRIRTRRHLPGHCPACGYNLSGNPSATACPECGKATQQTPHPPLGPSAS